MPITKEQFLALTPDEQDKIVREKQRADFLALPAEEQNRLVAEKMAASEAVAPIEYSQGEAAMHAGRSALEGATAGISEPILSGVAGVGAGLAGLTAPEQALEGKSRLELAKEYFNQAYAEDIAKRRQEKADMPKLDIAGQVAGAVIPSPLNVGAKIAGGMAKALAGYKGATLAGQVAHGAAEAGLSGLTYEGVRKAALETTGFVKPGEDPGLMETGLQSAAIGGAMPMMARALSLAAKAPKKALATLGGVKEETINKYLQNFERVQQAKSPEEMKELITQGAEEVKQKAIAAELNIADELGSGLEALKNKVIEGSKNAFSILEESGEAIDLNKVKQAAQNQMKALKVAGKMPIGESARSAYGKIQGFVNSLEGLPDNLPATEAKRLLQQIDQDVAYIQTPGAFEDNLGQKALKAIRQNIDAELKTKIPDYKKAMEVVSSDSRMLSDLTKEFGGQEKAFRAAKTIAKATPMRKEKFEELARMQGIDPSDFYRLQEQADAVKTFTGMNAGDKIKTLLSNRSDAIKNQFEKLGKATNQNFIQMVDDMNTAQAFDKEFRIGSRNVNLWSLMGLAAVGSISADDVMTGGVGGAILGAMADRYGPAVSRQILNNVAKVRGIPTVAKIRSMKLPDPVKEDLIDDLVRAGAIFKQDNSMKLDTPEEKAQALSDITGAKNLSVLEKAKMARRVMEKDELTDVDKLVYGKAPMLDKDNIAASLAKQKILNQNKPVTDAKTFMEKKTPKVQSY